MKPTKLRRATLIRKLVNDTQLLQARYLEKKKVQFFLRWPLSLAGTAYDLAYARLLLCKRERRHVDQLLAVPVNIRLPLEATENEFIPFAESFTVFLATRKNALFLTTRPQSSTSQLARMRRGVSTVRRKKQLPPYRFTADETGKNEA